MFESPIVPLIAVAAILVFIVLFIRSRRNAQTDLYLISQMPMMAETHRESTQANYGIDLDYSGQSLADIDDIISTHYRSGKRNLGDIVLGSFAAYVGETIKREWGGTWKPDRKYIFRLSDVAGCEEVFPCLLVLKRYEGGDEESIAGYYAKLRASIVKERGEDGARRPATAPESKSEGEEKPKPESEGRSL